MTRTLTVFSACALGCALLPATLLAQTAPADSQAPPPAAVRRPYRGLFGAPPDPSQPQSLMLTASVYGAYDDNVYADTTSNRVARDPRLRRSGYFPGAQSQLHYTLTGDNGSLDAMGGAQVHYYPDRSEFSSSYNSAVQFSRSLGRRTSVNGGYSLFYTPYYLALFPGAGGIEAPDATLEPIQELSTRTALHQSVDVSLRRMLSRRASLAFSYGASHVNFVEASSRDFRSQQYGVAFSNQLTSHATLKLGYRYRMAEHPGSGGRRSEVHDINAGVNYSRALSFSRRTSIAFSTGSAIIMADQLSGGGASQPRAMLRVTGDAELTHEMGRTWTAAASYYRGLTFREGFNEAFLTDGIVANLDGFLSRRVDLSCSVQWTTASVASTGDKGYDALAGSAQLRYALSRNLALFGRYIYYRYNFDRRLTIDPRLAPELDRNGVRVGLTVAIPFIH